MATFQALRGEYGRLNRRNLQEISKIINKFEVTGSVTDVPVRYAERKYRRTVTVSSERYGRMITDFFWPAIEDYELKDL